MRDAVVGYWRRLHREELHKPYFSPSIIRAIEPTGVRWAGHVTRTGEMRSLYGISAEKPDRKRPLGRTRLG